VTLRERRVTKCPQVNALAQTVAGLHALTKNLPAPRRAQ
jgi:hypothetical protein